MANSYKLSVVVLVYNTEQYLRDCLDSLVNQTLDGIEIIVVNDESPDNSHVIIEEYRQKYSNIRVINQKNSGGAVAGNNGMKHASGEYVTIMDSDDVVPLDAYEKLYKKAKETDADIVIGKANILVDGVQKEILYKKERDVWQREREITDLKEFPDIFYDGFYWNKIYKREFMLKNDCLMPPGMLYADRPMVHKAFLFAQKISIITDVVYLWRKRDENAAAKSITQLKYDINNFMDRISSLEYQIRYFEQYADDSLKSEFLKRNIDRLLFPIKGIVENGKFREVYLREVKNILTKINNVYDNDLGVIKNIYLYMILNDLRDELIYYLTNEPKGEIIQEGQKFYWNLPFFRHGYVKIPDDMFEIKVLVDSLVNIKAILVEDHCIKLQGVSVPKNFSPDKVKVVFQPRRVEGEPIVYELERGPKGSYNIQICLNDFNENNIYDVYLVFSLQSKEYKFRISSKMLRNFNKQVLNQKYTLYITNKGNLSFQIANFNNMFRIHFDIDKLQIETECESDPVIFYLKDRVSKEIIVLKKRNIGMHEISWKYFLDRHRFYDLYFRLFNQSFRLNVDATKGFSNEVLKTNNLYINIYKTKEGNISIKSYTYLVKLLSKFKQVVKAKS